jgi:hypothetical protein
MSTTRTYAYLEVSDATYREIKWRLRRAMGSHDRVTKKLMIGPVTTAEALNLDGLSLVRKKR